MRPCVESNCEGVPWRCNLGNMQMEGRGGGGPQGGKKKAGGERRFIMVRVRWRSRGSLVSQGRWGHGGAQQQSIRFQMHMNGQLLAPLKLWGEIAWVPFELQF